MKIKRVEPTESARKTSASQTPRRAFFARWYVQLALLVLAFGLGAVTYRSGVLRPAYQYVRGVLSGTQAIPAPEAVREAGQNLQDEIRMYENNGLPTLYIDLPFKGYQKLLDKRAEAIDIGVLNTTDADFVNGEVQLKDGPKLDAKLRLKGDWTDHLEGDKWSFRIHLKEDGQILHTRQFSIQSPDTRNFIWEWAFHKNLMEEGLLTTRYEFINVLLNGKLLGIYALEENFAPELIESQGRRQGVIIRFNEDLMWQSTAQFWAKGFTQQANATINSGDSADITVFQDSKIMADPVLSKEAQTAMDMLRAWQTGQRSAADVFDIDLLGRFFAVHDLWDACHGVAWHNLRFYYNPVTAHLEPVAYDAEPFMWCKPTESIISTFVETKLFDDPAVRAAYAKELKRMTQPEYVAGLVDEMQAQAAQLAGAMKVEFKDADLGVDWDALKDRSANLRLELNPDYPARGNYQILPADDTAKTPAKLVADVFNLMLLPVEVTGLDVNGQELQLGSPVELLPVKDPTLDAFQAVRIEVPLPDGVKLDQETNAVKVLARVKGLANRLSAELVGSRMPEAMVIGPVPQLPTRAEILKQHPFLVANPENPLALKVSPGVWDVQGDLILPQDTELFIPAGTVLKFSHGSILYATEALQLLGTENAPVVLTAQDDTWGGIIVKQAAKKSTWQYAAVEKTGGIDRNGWTLTGGITFFQADILLDHSFIGNNQTEDAINVIHGGFEFRDSHFANTFADAFDSDFSHGKVIGCVFEDIAGDAVDVSGTQVNVTDTRMIRITDKGVSVGEASDATIQRVQMDSVGIGVASKDLSKATISDSQINAARFSALAAYIKKPVYGPASITATHLTITATEKSSVSQKGSTILIDGKAVETVDLDVDLLYQQHILGN